MEGGDRVDRPVGKKEYYAISEVCELTGLRPHVLRYWESQFGPLRPTKNRAGNRSYRKKDIQLIQLIKYLLYEEGYTIGGAQKKLQRLQKEPQENLELPLEEIRARDIMRSIRDDLVELVRIAGT